MVVSFAYALEKTVYFEQTVTLKRWMNRNTYRTYLLSIRFFGRMNLSDGVREMCYCDSRFIVVVDM